jgi:hypothetical protein
MSCCAEAQLGAILDAMLDALLKTDDKVGAAWLPYTEGCCVTSWGALHARCICAGSGIVFIAPVHLQLVAKLALWGLSRQELLLGFLTTKAGAMLRALLPSLTVDNRWQVRVLTLYSAVAATTPCAPPVEHTQFFAPAISVKPSSMLTAMLLGCGAVIRVHQVRRERAGQAGGPLLAGHRGDCWHLAAADGGAADGGAHEQSAPGVCCRMRGATCTWQHPCWTSTASGDCT